MIEAKLHIFGSCYCGITIFLRTHKVGLTWRFKSFSAIFKTITLVIKLTANTTSCFFSILKIMSDSIANQNYTKLLIYSYVENFWSLDRYLMIKVIGFQRMKKCKGWGKEIKTSFKTPLWLQDNKGEGGGGRRGKYKQVFI